jgi:hypothetical protein
MQKPQQVKTSTGENLNSSNQDGPATARYPQCSKKPQVPRALAADIACAITTTGASRVLASAIQVRTLILAEAPR